MSDTVIKVENLGKKYLISHLADKREQLFSRLLVNKAKTAGSRVLDMFRSAGGGGGGEQTTEEFWALKDVSFEIEQGDRVGIIGRNGAGKSTLLKILSRITEPTKGRITIDGRVASLLEVGTGFHSELTGRENIYLNGAILGMSREEIKRKFDEVVAFAEVERFLDTPVKRYSSGMYVRLAFAVAAHLEPEILIVDEVLAVGDASFQKKCLGKMEEVSTKEGRTILFVSHNIPALQVLCTKGIQLRAGEVIGQGDIDNQIETYLNSTKSTTHISSDKSLRLSSSIYLSKFEFTPNQITSGESLEFIIELMANKPAQIDSLVLLIYSSLGIRVAIIDLRDSSFPLSVLDKPITLLGRIKSLPFVEGEYNVGLYMESGEVRENFLDITNISVANRIIKSGIIQYSPSVKGVVELDYERIT